MKIQQKCNHCGEWSEAENTAASHCPHCGSVFNDISYDRKRKRVESVKRNQVKINPHDKKVVKFVKKGTVLFLAIIVILTIVVILTHG